MFYWICHVKTPVGNLFVWNQLDDIKRATVERVQSNNSAKWLLFRINKDRAFPIFFFVQCKPTRGRLNGPLIRRRDRPNVISVIASSVNARVCLHIRVFCFSIVWSRSRPLQLVPLHHHLGVVHMNRVRLIHGKCLDTQV